jgi:hypothetical protein
MERIHWAGGIDLPKTKCLKGWPACVSGQRAYAIKYNGMMNSKDPKAVDCKRCQSLLRKAGLL